MKFLIIPALLVSFSLFAQEDPLKPKSIYGGLGYGLAYPSGVFILDANYVSNSLWGVSFDLQMGKNREAEPNNYRGGAFGDNDPDFYGRLDYFSFLLTRRVESTSDAGFDFSLGPSLCKAEEVIFDYSPTSFLGLGANYDVRYKPYQTWGVMCKIGLYGFMANWAGVELNIFAFGARQYSLIGCSAAFNLGWMGREK